MYLWFLRTVVYCTYGVLGAGVYLLWCFMDDGVLHLWCLGTVVYCTYDFLWTVVYCTYGVLGTVVY